MVVQVHEHLPPGRLSTAVRRVVARAAAAVVGVTDWTVRAFNEGLRPPVATRINIRPPPRAVRSWPRSHRRRCGRSSDRPECGAAGPGGADHPRKAQDTSIRALALLRGVGSTRTWWTTAGRVAFSGGGVRFDNEAYLRFLERLVRQLAVEDSVHFLGHREDVPAVFAALDLSLLPSWDEPFGTVAAESMAMGTPPIVTGVGGVAEYVKDRVSGRVLMPREPAPWADAAEALLRDREALAAMGAAARRGAARFTDAVYAAEMAAVYELALRAAAARARRRARCGRRAPSAGSAGLLQRSAAPATAAASRAAERDRRRRSRTTTRRRRARSAARCARPPRIAAGRSRRARSARAIALASVGTWRHARPRRGAAPPRRAAGRRGRRRRRPPRRARSATSAGVELAVAAGAEDARRRAGASRRCGAAASSTASASGLASPGSSPWASTSPPTSSSTTGRSRARAAASSSPAATARGPGFGSTSTVGSPSSSAMPRLGEAEAAGAGGLGPGERDGVVQRARRPSISSRRRGPGSGSIGRRSQVMPPTTRRAEALGSSAAAERADDVAAAADARRTRPRRRRAARAASAARLGLRRAPGRRASHDRRDLLGGARRTRRRESTGVPSKGRSR